MPRICAYGESMSESLLFSLAYKASLKNDILKQIFLISTGWHLLKELSFIVDE
jgi:hypothetical protein